MTNQQHPITPPPELLAQWEDDILDSQDNVDYVLDCVWRNGFQAGADQELEACCEWTQSFAGCGDSLRAARRTKPPSLKERALDALQSMRISPELIAIINANTDLRDKYETIRRVLETL